MSQRHQASRRRTYGRRQHEIHEVQDRIVKQDGSSSWLGESAAIETKGGWTGQFVARSASDRAFVLSDS